MESWRESVTNLKSLLIDDPTNSKVEKCCAALLNGGGDNTSGETTGLGRDAEEMPTEVRGIITTIYLRALIRGGKYSTVVDLTACQDTNENVLETAYALYRLKKYDACAKLCSNYLETNNGDNGSTSNNRNRRAIHHIHAQSLYRMGNTASADEIYKLLLDTDSNMDADEKEDLMANALANRTANYTPGSLLGSERPWLESIPELTSPLQSYANGEEEEILQNYDLAYNLATYLLVTSDARSRLEVESAKSLLEAAQKSALTVLESTTADAGEEKSEEERKKKQQLAAREAMPIKVNLAYANLLLGGEENEKEALRAFLTVIMDGSRKKQSGAGKGSSGVEANLLAAASNNLAILRDGKESVFDVLKRIPSTSCATEDGNKGGKSGGLTCAPTLVGTPQQVRSVLFNRALQLAKMGNVSGCMEALAILRASLKVSYRGDYHAVEGGKVPGSPKRNKVKKKKGSTVSESNDAEVGVDLQDVPAAQPSSEVEAVAWNARADWVESELRRVVASDKKSDDIINSAISSLDAASKNSNNEGAGASSLMKAQLLLHNSAVANGQSKPQPLIATLESLPPLVRSCPGTTVTLASLHAALNKEESFSRSAEIMSSLGDNIPARLATAEFHLERGQYDDATQLLEGVLDEEDAATTDQLMTATALLVQAFSYTDPEKAEEYAETLREACGESELDGEELESMEIPRFAKKAGGAAGSSKVRKMIASTDGKRGANHRQSNKKNREAILRKRAKQRDAYLKELESKGLYDPNKVPQSKPDPERWIPKSQRSYNRRGRRGRYNSNIGAQGGGAGAGMEKDAAKLDVAARVAAAKSGATDGTGKLSTANIQVSGSGPARKGKGGKRR